MGLRLKISTKIPGSAGRITDDMIGDLDQLIQITQKRSRNPIQCQIGSDPWNQVMAAADNPQLNPLAMDRKSLELFG
jgi:hypothetical protein